MRRPRNYIRTRTLFEISTKIYLRKALWDNTAQGRLQIFWYDLKQKYDYDKIIINIITNKN